MSCFILCQSCGEIYDSEEQWNHVCNSGDLSTPGFCDNCGQQGNELILNGAVGTYSHMNLRDCIKNLRDEINRTESHNIENDSRFCDIEKKLSGFVKGRRAAIAATKEKMALEDD